MDECIKIKGTNVSKDESSRFLLCEGVTVGRVDMKGEGTSEGTNSVYEKCVMGCVCLALEAVIMENTS